MFQRGKLRTSVIMTRIVLLSLVVQAPAIKGNHIKNTDLYFGEKNLNYNYNTQHAFLHVLMEAYREYR